MTLIWFWKAKGRRGSKKETVLLCFLFLVELQHIGFPRAAVRTSLLRALQLIDTWYLSDIYQNIYPCIYQSGIHQKQGRPTSCLRRGAWIRWTPPALHEPVFKAASTDKKHPLASGRALLETYGLQKVISTAAFCWAGSQQAHKSRGCNALVIGSPGSFLLMDFACMNRTDVKMAKNSLCSTYIRKKIVVD